MKIIKWIKFKYQYIIYRIGMIYRGDKFIPHNPAKDSTPFCNYTNCPICCKDIKLKSIGDAFDNMPQDVKDSFRWLD